MLLVCPVGCSYSSVPLALQVAQPGDTIMLSGGVYDFDVTVNITIPLTLSYVTRPPSLLFVVVGDHSFRYPTLTGFRSQELSAGPTVPDSSHHWSHVADGLQQFHSFGRPHHLLW